MGLVGEGEVEGWNLLGFVLYIEENLNPKFESIWSWFEGSWIFDLFLCSWTPSNLHKEEDSPKGHLIQKLSNFSDFCGKKKSNWPICDTTCESHVEPASRRLCRTWWQRVGILVAACATRIFHRMLSMRVASRVASCDRELILWLPHLRNAYYPRMLNMRVACDAPVSHVAHFRFFQL